MARMSVFRFSAVALLLLAACCWADDEEREGRTGANGTERRDRDCWSYVGRRGGKQVVSLARSGCLYHGTVQHELLHALGFNHELTRSDRDNHIRVMLQNVISGMEHNFNKIATLNQGTPYDYGSVMQYHKYAFSKNNQPTMVPIPNANVSLGNAKEMSRNDIARLNTLYSC
ncbi:low choriolytic enzyme-like [Pungitius pungitius]|uniref:low choriolytic enzyme-like n=1 Tax=Pungitius pungitius TaxID=134920 RepID=UPI002E0FDDA5